MNGTRGQKQLMTNTSEIFRVIVSSQTPPEKRDEGKSETLNRRIRRGVRRSLSCFLRERKARNWMSPFRSSNVIMFQRQLFAFKPLFFLKFIVPLRFRLFRIRSFPRNHPRLLRFLGPFHRILSSWDQQRALFPFHFHICSKLHMCVP